MPVLSLWVSATCPWKRGGCQEVLSATTVYTQCYHWTQWKQSTIAGFWAVLWEGRGKGYAQGWLSRRRDLKVRAEPAGSWRGPSGVEAGWSPQPWHSASWAYDPAVTTPRLLQVARPAPEQDGALLVGSPSPQPQQAALLTQLGNPSIRNDPYLLLTRSLWPWSCTHVGLFHLTGVCSNIRNNIYFI